jgi:hypothetical protein
MEAVESLMALTSAILKPAQTLVYTRRVLAQAGGVAPLPVNGERSGWVLDPRLRADVVRWMTGAQVGDATLTFVPSMASQAAFEEQLAQYHPDDQVKIVMLPVEDELVQPVLSDDDDDTEEVDPGLVLFEGVMGRHIIRVDGRGETVQFVAVPFPRLDNAIDEHLIRGRICAYRAGEEPVDGGYGLIESPALPCVFNHAGRPNRSATGSRPITVSTLETELTGWVFTHDDDAPGEFWTLRSALLHLIVWWTIGPLFRELNHHFTVDHDLAFELASDPESGERAAPFRGLDDQIPEVDVHGLGVLDAIERVCASVGWRMSVEPVALDPEDALAPDRRYVLRCWKNGATPIKWFDLDRRSAGYADAEAATTANNIGLFQAQRDAHETVSTIYAAGRLFLECRLLLLPLWHDYEVSDAAASGSLQQAPTASQLAMEEYFYLHVPGGAGYTEAPLRHWGVDCTGAMAGNYEGTNYEHPGGEDGYGWVEALGLNDSIMRTDRVPPADDDQIRWTTRIRPLLPLRSTRAVAAGIEYLLEVDEGSGFVACPAKFRTLREACGISLQVPNLAAINNATFTTGVKPPPAASWYALIKSQTLKFRITAVIEADHAERYDLLRQTSSGSQYNRGLYLAGRNHELWIQPGSRFHPAYPSAGADWYQDSVTGLETTARSLRDELEQQRISCSASTWRMDQATAYRLGDRIAGVRGRGYSLATDGGQGERGPVVAGLTFRLAPAEQQRIDLTLEDQRMGNAGQGSRQGVTRG